jgi:hypothetical protein
LSTYVRVNQPTPALVTQRAAQRLPRPLLWCFCAAYLLPGLFGRDPWRNADITAYGFMAAMAQGRTSWLSPTLGGLHTEGALLPHWLGAAFIAILSPGVDAPLAARLPFALLLALSLALIWYTTFRLASTEAAQPVPFAFGGEAAPIDYARALADGALLATIASLGLLQLGHETTPELVQLFAVTLFLWALASAPHRIWTPRIASVIALVADATSGAPSMAVAFGLIGGLVCARSHYPKVRQLLPWIAIGIVLAALLSNALGAWAWRLDWHDSPKQILQLARLFLWFLWPVWPLALWTVWRWRRHLMRRHIAIPMGSALVACTSCALMGGSDRALMLAVPGLAVLAAFSLPTLHRSTGAAIDWFSVFFFTASAVTLWVFYLGMQWGVPAKAMATVNRLLPGFKASFSLIALAFALAGSIAWLWLVRWRTAQNRHPLWKSLVLPASGVALSWLLAMTLLLPALDYARSPRALINEIGRHVPPGGCVLAPGTNRTLVAALQVFGHYTVYAGQVPLTSDLCATLVIVTRRNAAAPPLPAQWQLVKVDRRPTEREEQTLIYRIKP